MKIIFNILFGIFIFGAIVIGIFTQIVLKRNGYKISYSNADLSFYKKLWQLSKKKKKIKFLLLVNILLPIWAVTIFILFIIFG